MSKFYTGVGDSGDTFVGKKKVSKSDSYTRAVNEIDKLNSYLGVILAKNVDERIGSMLSKVQDDLFIAGAQIASALDNMYAPKRKLSDSDVREFERSIESYGSKLPELKKFVLPRGSEEGAMLHYARSLARSAEIAVVEASKSYSIDGEIVRYLNRLSSLLFVMALYSNMKSGKKESNPRY
ncbi:MAG: cob(I)yrinic acid a,c-diamide adenosyltransferase [Candidatus Marsarchaeota archaeon]|nr:cob(I)yrinic acid a,c-diamide adenosyltransferase [Candidatus Marsarchaeota archaeon]MCL5007063.1 cob(I)yrinic acid a,c-diamide adenosyltransferase [Candidatus Marsarchaeota archaeon]MCL5430915.1 cob(I)yrinic acid a,c-diamide adenosyltransferase [Candidatus Marsarchaeota archaeon]